MKILFMCVANAARSQMAEGLARHLLPEATIASAGSKPAKLNPYSVKVMSELGIDISHHYSKSIDDLKPDLRDNLNYVITLCAEEVCPVLPSKTAKKLHWPFPDPFTRELISEDQMLNRFREARDNIKRAIEKFAAEELK